MELDHWQKKFDALKPHLLQVNSRVGPILVYANDSIISYAIRMYGEYSHAEVDILAEYLDKDSGFVDVGTNIGYHSKGIAAKVGCDILAFEPNPNHFVVASYNCKNLPIQLLNAAVGESDGITKINIFDPTKISNYGEVSVDQDEGEAVALMKLDSVDIVKCHVIKIDVEGNEYQVLLGAEETINKFKPVVFYEALTQNADIWHACWDWLHARGYQQYWVACRNYPVAETFIPKGDRPNPFGNGGVMNILAVPAGKKMPTNLMPVDRNENFFETMARYLNNPKYIVHF